MKPTLSAFALAIGATYAVTAISAEAAAKPASSSISTSRATPRSLDMPTRRHVHGVTRSRLEPAAAPSELENYWQQLQNEGS